MKKIVDAYQKKRYFHDESHLSRNLWGPLLEFMVQDHTELILISEFKLTDLELDYLNLSVDFCVIQNRQNGPYLDFPNVESNDLKELPNLPLLFVELSKNPLRDLQTTHEDQEKTAVTMTAAMNKIFSVTWGRGKEFLRKLRIYGLLCGASDFDICRLYPVFPDENSDEFYFVYETSKTHLRFRVLEDNVEDITVLYSTDEKEVENPTLLFKYPHTENEKCDLPEIKVEDKLLEEKVGYIDKDSTEDENEASNDSAKQKSTRPAKIDESMLKAKYLVSNGSINEEALRILVKLAELVRDQSILIGDLNEKAFESKFKFDEARVKLMDQGRSGHQAQSPGKRKHNTAFSSFDLFNTPTKQIKMDDNMLSDLIDVLRSKLEKDNCMTDSVNVPSPVDLKSSVYTIVKTVSPYEIQIYSRFKHHPSPFCPELFNYTVSTNFKHVKMEIEELKVLKDFRCKDGETGIFKLMVDVLGGLRILHSLGYVHGDISINNLGFNHKKGIWQLFDFDNSQRIEDANAEDDYFSFANTLKKVIGLGIFDTTKSEIANILKLIEPLLKVYLMDDCGYFDKFYVDCVKHFLKLCQTPNESQRQSIAAMIPLLEQIIGNNE